MKSFNLKLVKKIASALAIIVFLFGVVSVRVQGQGAVDPSLKIIRTSPADTLRNKTGQTTGTVREETREGTQGKREDVREKVQEQRSKLQEKREELRTKAEERKEERKEKIAQKRAEKIKEFGQRIKEKLLAMVERLEKLAERIQSRIDKLAEKGANTQEAQAQLDEAKTKLAAVKARISGLEGVGADIVSTDNPRELFGAVKEEVQGIKKDLVEVHRLLASSMGKIKGLSGAVREKTGTEGGQVNE